MVIICRGYHSVNAHYTTELCLSPEVNSHSAGEIIPHLLWNPKIHYRFQNNPLLSPILVRMNPVRIFTYYFWKIYFNIIFPPTPRDPE
jgi:hypothetical protein